jgi:hypothetical protein
MLQSELTWSSSSDLEKIDELADSNVLELLSRHSATGERYRGSKPGVLRRCLILEDVE